MLMYHCKIVQVPHTLVSHPSVVGPRRMSAACRFAFATQYRNFTTVFLPVRPVFIPALRNIFKRDPPFTSERTTSSPRKFWCRLRNYVAARAFYVRLENNRARTRPMRLGISERSRGFYGLGENDATVDNDRH